MAVFALSVRSETDEILVNEGITGARPILYISVAYTVSGDGKSVPW